MDRYNGALTITQMIHDGDHFLMDRPLPLRIDQADPRICIAPELLEEIRREGHHPDATITGDVLRIAGVNRTVEYRIGEAVIDGFGRRLYLADRIDP